MDTSDPQITFNVDGVCNHCLSYPARAEKTWFPTKEGAELLARKVELIKRDGKNSEYDCILGLSGGVDSSYLSIKLKDMGLRTLALHVDAGWNSELAVKNIESIVKYCNFDLHTHVVNWEEMADLQRSYLKAAISNQDVPQDHIFFSSLYHFANSNKIKHVISGGNFATESVFPDGWHGSAMDSQNLKAIHSAYGKVPLKDYRTISFFEYYVWYPIVKQISTFRPLNFMPYNKKDALKELKDKVNYKPYPRKHGESLFTKFFQNYYLPKKFGIDKRRAHLSSLILSKQLSRDEALNQLAEPLYDPDELATDINYLCKKLEISQESFSKIMEDPIRHYSEFPNWDNKYNTIKKIQKIATRMFSYEKKFYS